MIQFFACKDTRQLFETGHSRRFSSIARVAIRKLTQLDNAIRLEDLRVPPGNCLETLEGDQKGQRSIRVNDQFRICFVWDTQGVYSVEIVDYR